MALTSGEIIGAWIAMGLTFVMFSFLYKDNIVFKFGEHLYVGLSAGYGLCYACIAIVWPDLIRPLYRVISSSFGAAIEGKLESYESWWLLIPLIFSILMLTRFVPKIAWLSRWSIAFIMGATSGMAIPLVVSADIFKQLVPTLQPLYPTGQTAGDAFMGSFGAVMILVGVVTVLVYFFFSAEHKGPVKVVARIGVFYMMVSFGAAFGYTVMARETLAIARFQDMIKFGGGDYQYGSIITFLAVALLIVIFELVRRNSSKTPAKD